MISDFDINAEISRQIFREEVIRDMLKEQEFHVTDELVSDISDLDDDPEIAFELFVKTQTPRK